MSKIASLCLVWWVGAVWLAGCSKPQASEELAPAVNRNPPEARSGSPFKVALLTPGPVSDAGWNASAYEGLQNIQRELGAEIAHQETKSPADIAEGFRDFASQGYNLVFGHGFEYQEPAAKASKDFPETIFITTSGNTVKENVSPMVFKLEEATYLMGMMAALMSKTGKAGLVGGMKIPSIESTFNAFAAGAKAVRPDFQAKVAYTGDFKDVVKAKEQTNALIEQGCDFIIHNANEGVTGVFDAVKAHPGVYAFGTNKNQNDLGPDFVLASGIIDIPKAFVTVARRVHGGEFKPGSQILNMKDGIISLVYNPRLEGKIPAEVKRKIDKAKADMLSGKLQVKSSFL
ncbi:MAG: BMP family protein [Armatimonadetes bacterium]|nr:BMP family protein [Armatimonadota bacterium]